MGCVILAETPYFRQTNRDRQIIPNGDASFREPMATLASTKLPRPPPHLEKEQNGNRVSKRGSTPGTRLFGLPADVLAPRRVYDHRLLYDGKPLHMI